jgi:hypothetical protein
MKARLTFDLNDPDDAMAHKRCIHSTGMALVIWELINNGHRCNNFSELYDKILKECEQNGIIIEDLIV